MNNRHLKALVLGGGAARGFAHIGIWKTLEEKGEKFDIITGNSMGSIIGALIADGKKSAEILKILEELSWAALVSLPGKGYLQSGDTITKVLEKYFAAKKIEDLKIKFACIATDIDTGEEVVFRTGPILDSLRASISIPGVFKPVLYKRRYLVDGGLVNNLPILEAERMGASDILAINVRRPKKRKTDFTSYSKIKNTSAWESLRHWGVKMFYDLIEKSYDIMASAMDEKQMIVKPSTKLKVINVPLGKIEYRDFLKWKEIVRKGEQVKIP